MEGYKVPNSDIRCHFQMMGAIAFIPEDDVSMAWRFVNPFSLWTWQSSAVATSQHGFEHRPPIQPFLTTNGASTTLPRCCFHGVPTSLRDGITDSTQCYRVHTPPSRNSWIV